MNKKQWANALISLTVLMILVYGISRLAAAPDIVSLLNPEVEPSRVAADLEDEVVLDGVELKINQVTKQVTAVFELSNNSKTSVSDMSILCDFYDDSGRTWGRGRWKIYATLPPNLAETYVLTDRRYVSYHARAELSRCRLVDLNSVEAAAASEGGGH